LAYLALPPYTLFSPTFFSACCFKFLGRIFQPKKKSPQHASASEGHPCLTVQAVASIGKCIPLATFGAFFVVLKCLHSVLLHAKEICQKNCQKNGSQLAAKKRNPFSMQIVENNVVANNVASKPGRVGESSARAVNGCISKGEICFLLRPSLTRCRTHVLRSFFTPERIAACGIPEEELFSQRFRIFPPDASAFIIAELKSLNFL